MGEDVFVNPFTGQIHALFDHPYNSTLLNERAVEVPVALSLLDHVADPDNVLEIGCVLPHYRPGYQHHVIDLYEYYPGVVNADVLTYEPGRTFDLVLAISTLEHLVDEAQFKRALRRILSWLMPRGRFFVSVPYGQYPWLTPLLLDDRPLLPGMKVARFDKMAQYEWVESNQITAPFAYNKPYRWANSVYLMLYQHTAANRKALESAPASYQLGENA